MIELVSNLDWAWPGHLRICCQWQVVFAFFGWAPVSPGPQLGQVAWLGSMHHLFSRRLLWACSHGGWVGFYKKKEKHLRLLRNNIAPKKYTMSSAALYWPKQVSSLHLTEWATKAPCKAVSVFGGRVGWGGITAILANNLPQFLTTFI